MLLQLLQRSSVLVARLPITQVTAQLKAVRESGISSVAVVFAHAYTFPDHEQQVREQCVVG